MDHELTDIMELGHAPEEPCLLRAHAQFQGDPARKVRHALRMALQ